MFTRFLDIMISLCGCLLTLLILPVIALLIKVDSQGPVFFKCDRVGKDGRIFKMLKFRTMHETSHTIGASVSPLGDPRVTQVGRMLRRLKLNELPQFFNVLKGEMTLVGPRPEAPDLAVAYPPEARRIFTVKPGLFGPNQISGRNEEELYPSGINQKAYYLENILPPKIAVDLQYIEEKSFWKDCKYLFLGVWVTFSRALSRRHLFDNYSHILQMTCDAGLCLLSFTLAHLLRFEGFSDPRMRQVFLRLLFWAVILRLPFFVYFNFYHILIRYFSYQDVKNIFKGVTLSSVVFIGFYFFVHVVSWYSRAVFVIDWFCLSILLIGYRAMLHQFRRYNVNGSAFNGSKRRALIWGAGDWGDVCLSCLRNMKDPSYEILGFIDDNVKKRNRHLNGVRVLGDRHHLKDICQLYKVQEIFITIQSVPPEELQAVMEICQDTGLTTRLFSPVIESDLRSLSTSTSNVS
jgi:lipopolysaccharide/colanic/teichoic acid biosynthesis glycosyltransferase